MHPLIYNSVQLSIFHLVASVVHDMQYTIHIKSHTPYQVYRATSLLSHGRYDFENYVRGSLHTVLFITRERS